jgi:hypothetical protein
LQHNVIAINSDSQLEAAGFGLQAGLGCEPLGLPLLAEIGWRDSMNAAIKPQRPIPALASAGTIVELERIKDFTHVISPDGDDIIDCQILTMQEYDVSTIRDNIYR